MDINSGAARGAASTPGQSVAVVAAATTASTTNNPRRISILSPPAVGEASPRAQLLCPTFDLRLPSYYPITITNNKNSKRLRMMPFRLDA
jgi:hypothetical protein